jgi:hypothetical protein
VTVYLAAAGGDRLKIGYTAGDPHARAQAQGCKLLVHAPGDRSTETALIQRFTKLRVNGREWFRDHPRIRRHFADIPDAVVTEERPAEAAYQAFFNDEVRIEAIRLLAELACPSCQKRILAADVGQLQLFEAHRRISPGDRL